jgi:holin-like protein
MKFPETKAILKFLAGIAVLLLSYYTGDVISYLINGFISPAVMGMIILFLLLKSGITKVEWVEKPATFLLDNLMLFFIPATVGIALIPYEVIKDEYITIILTATLSSFLVLWLVGFIVEKHEKSDK